jgi:amino acid adenylation domain-containing protein/FkbM family methyltransferase
VTEVGAAAKPQDQVWWTNRLRAHKPDSSGIPLFRRRSGLYRRKSALVELPFPPELNERLAARGDTSSEQLYEHFLTAAAGILYRYSGSGGTETVVVGSPVTVSPSPDGELSEWPPVLPVPIEVEPDMPFGALLARAAASAAASRARPNCSITELADELELGDVTNRNPIFTVALRVAGWHPPLPDLRNDVTVTISRAGSLELEYNANVLDEATVARFGRHVAVFLARGLAETARPVRDIDYLAPDEHTLLLDTWSGGPVAPPDPRCLHELFEEAAREHPEAEAIVDGEQTITYEELDARASRLAHYLRAQGVSAGSRVGLCLPASAELLISAIAIPKAGAAVVPLVPTFPVPRNRMVIEDSGMAVVVTDSSFTGLFAGTGVTVVNIEERAAEIGGYPAASPHAGTSPDDVAYIMFTSGSTGRPKGVALEHKTIVNLVLWQRDRGRDPAGQRTLQRTSIGFDVSFQEIFSTLGFGGCLVVAPDEVRDDVSLLPGFIEQHSIARIFLPPVALDQMAVTANLAQRSLPTLREVIVAGEQLRISMPIRRLFHQIECALDNQYGPTETHVATAYALAGPSTRWPETPPIGTPVRNVRVYVLDPWLRPVPAGVPGEICIGGLGPARGYLDANETRERFIAGRFGQDGERIYRTGDRGRFLTHGAIEFLGRPGDQVKIRGYRIELGEIEATLLQIPGIRQAAVTVHESDVLGKQLAAYVVAEQPEQPDAATIRRLLLERLPDHMVPPTASIVHTGALPTTPTGKVDRRALPPPPQAAAASYAAAEGDTEQTVANILAQALGLEKVGRDDNFIELGGHSLVGIQAVAQLNELYSIALPLRSLLRGATVAILAAEIDSLRARTGGTPPASAEAGAAPALQEVTLADSRRIYCLQPAETQYLHLDVFGHRTYDRGGIRYPETGVVFDVGAHVGLFALYALERSPALRIFAFEPCPPLYEALRKNTEKLPNVRRFPFGLSSRVGTAELTFYPNLTGMSSFHPDEQEERTLLARILENLGKQEETQAAALLAGSEEYLSERLLASSYTVQCRTLSDVLAETGTERVDLLKIDVQKSELEVLDGIALPDWAKIRQLVIELHDQDGRLDKIRSLLTGQGYRVVSEQDPLHAGTVVHFLYAVRE